MSKEIFPVLYDHYKDTCNGITDLVKKRDYIMVYIVVAITIFSFQILSPTLSNQMINDIAGFKFGLKFDLNLKIIGSITWLVLLLFVIRYFQIAVFIERRYKYMHQLEDNLNKYIGRDIIVREGKHYLNKYPWFLTWLWLLYTLMFPLLLYILIYCKITNEWNTSYSHIGASLLIDTLFFFVITVSIILYLIMLHLGRDKKTES